MAARYERGLFDPDAPQGTSPVRPHHLGHRRRRLPPGGHLRRGVLARGPPEARQPRPAVGRQPHLHRGRHRDRGLRGHAASATRPTAGTCSASRRRRTATWTPRRCTRRSRRRKAETGRPSFIAVRSIIAWPAPNAQNTEAAHGSALGDEEVAATKRVLGFDPEQSLRGRRRGARAHPRRRSTAAVTLKQEWEKRFADWRTANPERAAEFDRIAAGELPEGWEDHLPSSRPARPWPPATRPARCCRRSAR